MNIIANAPVYFWEDVIVRHKYFETIGLQLVQCILESNE